MKLHVILIRFMSFRTLLFFLLQKKCFCATLKVGDTAGFLQEQEIHHESASRGKSEFEYCILFAVRTKKQPNSTGNFTWDFLFVFFC